METVIIKINWQNKNSIKQAERRKKKLENKGYKFKEAVSGFKRTTLKYQK